MDIIRIKENDCYWNPTPVNRFETYLSNLIYRGCGYVNVYALRKNIAYNLQYLQFLDKVLTDISLTSVLTKQNIKMFILVGCGIIESILTFLIKTNDIQKKSDWEIIEKSHGSQFKKGDHYYKIDSLLMKKRSTPIDEEMTFDAMLKKAEKKHLLGREHTVYEKLNHLRKLRNKVHLQCIDHSLDHDWNNFDLQDLGNMALCLYEVLTNKVFSPNDQNKDNFKFLKEIIERTTNRQG